MRIKCIFLPNVIAVVAILFICHHITYAQSFYIATSNQEILLVDIATCNTSLQTTVDYAGGGVNMNDIAFHPDGTLYGITSDGDLVSIDLTTGFGTFVLNVPPLSSGSGDQFTSLITDKDGNLLAADKVGRLFSIDVSGPTIDLLGTISPGNGASGDLSFNGGQLYMTSNENTLVKVNINNPSASTEVSTFSVSDIFGVVSVFTTCTQINTYVISQSKEILVINDISTGVTSPACDLSGQFSGSIYGAAAIDESEASECKLECDFNGSANGQNGSVTFDCSSTAANLIDPAVADIISTSNLNEIILTFSGTPPDGTDETLIFSGVAPGGISVSPSSGTSITLSNSADVDDYLDALALITYNNAAATPTAGQRSISLNIKNDDGESDNMCTIEINVNCAPVTLNIDLDDLSSGNNHSGDFDCTADEFVIAPDPVFTPTVMDSFVLEITDGILDIGDERIEINPIALMPRRSSDTKVTLINNSATPSDFISTLSSARYINAANPKSAGNRIITVTGFLNGDQSSPARATMRLDGPDAGRFDPLDICITGETESLFDATRPSFPPDEESGSWTLGLNGPTLDSGSDLFDPSIDVSGTYVYSLLNACNVRDTASLDVNVVDPADFDVIPDTAFFCSGSTVTLNGSGEGGSSPQWAIDRNGNTIVNNGFSYTIDNAGLYYLLVNLNSCELVDSTDVKEIPVGNLDVKIFPDTSVVEICDDQSQLLEAVTENPPSNDPISYQWSSGQSEPSIEVDDRGVYIVTARLFCDEGKDSIRIQLENCNCPIFVPNAFSPLSSNGVNNTFYPITDSCATLLEENSNLSIFNRWGELIHSGGADKPWNGGGNPLDTYAWHFTYSYRSPVDETDVIEEEMKGFVILVR